MEVFPIAASLSPPVVASIDRAQDVLAHELDRTLIRGNDTITSPIDIVEVSPSGRLLSSVAAITDAADTAETGSTINNEAILDEAQRFVDSVNALNLGGQLLPEGLIDDVEEPPLGTTVPIASDAVETEIPGINVVAVDGENDVFVLTLDSEALNTALEVDAATVSSQLAAVALPVGELVATQVLAVQPTTIPIPQVFAGGTATVQGNPVLDNAAPVIPVVPDLTVENAELRQALADDVLADIINVAFAGVGSQALVQEGSDQVAPLVVAEPGGLEEGDFSLLDDTDVEIETPSALGNIASPAFASVNSSSIPNATLTPAAPPQAVPPALTLSPAELITTPLEQISQLAANPTVAGAVAAFQIPADDGSRARAVATPGVGAVNPVGPVLATGAVSPHLTGNKEQRRDNLQDARVNQWWATRPGLF